MGRIICELERIYGVKRGGDRVSKVNNVQHAKQSDIANKIGIDEVPMELDVSREDLWSKPIN